MDLFRNDTNTLIILQKKNEAMFCLTPRGGWGGGRGKLSVKTTGGGGKPGAAYPLLPLPPPPIYRYIPELQKLLLPRPRWPPLWAPLPPPRPPLGAAHPDIPPLAAP